MHIPFILTLTWIKDTSISVSCEWNDHRVKITGNNQVCTAVGLAASSFSSLFLVCGLYSYSVVSLMDLIDLIVINSANDVSFLAPHMSFQSNWTVHLKCKTETCCTERIQNILKENPTMNFPGKSYKAAHEWVRCPLRVIFERFPSVLNTAASPTDPPPLQPPSTRLTHSHTYALLFSSLSLSVCLSGWHTHFLSLCFPLAASDR